ncbi:TolC family protein [Fulvivirga sp. M361]|uniref:TolC family protein n=1 Tax=Fulvivirga sp. M361 TaxID=2594266 RepID=UPI0011799B89|nr:TolC family protein [Fulvivirga sp. M361]TRX49665.1 TolC family protein [Fulvivirga sp. M361]
MRKNIILLLTILACGFYELKAQSLEDYFKLVAENNPGLQARYKDFEAALQKIPQASTLPDPTFSFGYFISPVETRVGPQRARFSLTQMFPWFGTLRSKGDAAALLADAKYEAFLDVRNQLYYQVAASYYPLYELERWTVLEQENMEILESYKTISTKQFENGNGAMVDVLRADIMLKDAATNLQILKEKRKPLLAAFNALLNRNENEEVAINDTLAIETLLDDYRRDSLFLDNPILKQIELKLKASEEMERVAIKQGLPKFGVGLDYAIVGNRSGVELPDNGQDILMPMVSISIPIFRKKYNAAIKEAQLSQESYQLQREDYTNRLIANYESTAFELDRERQLIELYDQQIEESQQALNLLYTAYSNSGKEFEEVLRMQQQLLKYEKMKATAITNYHTALAKLDYITAKKY